MWAPDASTALRMFLLLRMTGAIFAPIMDCDETFNYWEPLHYMMYGRGYQTWEYAPEFALRSYGYLLPHAAAAYASGAAFGLSKTHSFALLRALLAGLTVACEMYLYAGIKKRCGNALGAAYLWISLFLPGLWHAAPAFIPSAFAMQCTALAYGAFLRGKQQYPLAVFIAAASVLLGWPFAGLVFLPMGLHILAAACLQCGQTPTACTDLLKIMAGGVAGIVLPATYSFVVDSWFYGRPVLPVWNIIKYNVFGQGGDGSGSELYGVEPASYYLKNLLLNFNMALPLAVAAPLVLLALLAAKAAGGSTDARWPKWVNANGTAASLGTICAAVFLWVGFMTSNPHKEERFLFPVYALLPLMAAMGLRGGLHLLAIALENCGLTSPTVTVPAIAGAEVGVARSKQLSAPSRWAERCMVLLVCGAMTLFLGRAGILHMAYSAPMSAWAHVSHITLGGFVNTYPVSKQFNMQVPFFPIALAATMGWRPEAWAHRITARDNATVEAARVLAGWGSPPRGAAAWLSDSAMDLPFKAVLAVGMNSSTAARQWVAEASLPHQDPLHAPVSAKGVTPETDQLTRRGHSAYYGGRVCVGKEWYRVPSHHFTPGVTSAGLSSLPPRTGMPPRTTGGPLQLAFVQGGFGGHLPQLFLHPALGGSHANVSGFNDRNAGDTSVFVDVATCDLVVDLHLPGAGAGVNDDGSTAEPWFAGATNVPPDVGVDEVGRRMANEGGVDPPPHAAGVVANHEWISIWSGWFLAADRAPAWSRALYVPWVSEQAWREADAWVRYRVLARKDVARALAPYALQGMVIPTSI